MTDSTAPAVLSATPDCGHDCCDCRSDPHHDHFLSPEHCCVPALQNCATCAYGVVLGTSDEIPCPHCGGAFLASAPLPSSAFVCPGERTCRVCPEHQYSEPQDQR